MVAGQFTENLKMYKNKRILGIITARGGSKGLPRKNIKKLLGKPLIVWTIEKALESRYLDKLIVSTDDHLIARISKKYGAGVPFKRPKKLAQDKSKSIDVIIHAIDFLKKKKDLFDYILLLEPTSPLRNNGDIDKAISKLVDTDSDSLISFGKITLEHPHFAKKLTNHGYMVPFFGHTKKLGRRQDLSCAHYPYGAIYISSVKSLYKYRTFYQKKTLPYFLERWQCYEIDDIYDFITVEAVLKNILKNILLINKKRK